MGEFGVRARDALVHFGPGPCRRKPTKDSKPAICNHKLSATEWPLKPPADPTKASARSFPSRWVSVRTLRHLLPLILPRFVGAANKNPPSPRQLHHFAAPFLCNNTSSQRFAALLCRLPRPPCIPIRSSPARTFLLHLRRHSTRVASHFAHTRDTRSALTRRALRYQRDFTLFKRKNLINSLDAALLTRSNHATVFEPAAGWRAAVEQQSAHVATTARMVSFSTEWTLHAKA